MRVKGAAAPKPAAMSLEPMGFLQLMGQPGAPSMPYSLLHQAAFPEVPAPAAAAAADGGKARPARKRKQAAFLEDAIPLDAVLGRNVKAKAGEERPKPKAKPAPKPAARKPPAAKAAGSMAPAAGKGAAPKGGIRAPAGSKPAAKPAAKPARDPRKPPVAPAPRRPSTPAGGQKQQSPAAAAATALALQRPPPMAYRLVGPAVQRRDAAGAPLPLPAALPATTLALPTQIVSLAAFMMEEERRRQSAASDGRVLLSVLPGGQLPQRGRGSKTVMRGSGRPAPAARPPRGRASREGSAPAAEAGHDSEGEEAEVEEDAGPAVAEAGPSAKGRGKGGRGAAGGRATPDLPPLPPGHWRPGMSMHGGINCVDAVESMAAPPLPPAAVGPPPHWRPVASRQAEPEVRCWRCC